MLIAFGKYVAAATSKIIQLYFTAADKINFAELQIPPHWRKNVIVRDQLRILYKSDAILASQFTILPEQPSPVGFVHSEVLGPNSMQPAA